MKAQREGRTSSEAAFQPPVSGAPRASQEFPETRREPRGLGPRRGLQGAALLRPVSRPAEGCRRGVPSLDERNSPPR